MRSYFGKVAAACHACCSAGCNPILAAVHSTPSLDCLWSQLACNSHTAYNMVGGLNVLCMLDVLRMLGVQRMHCRYLFGQHTPNWRWLSFFAIQGPLIAAERCSTRISLRCGIKKPRWVSVPLTLSVLLLTANQLFFSVWYETPFADRMNAALQNDVRSLATLLQLP